MSEKITFTFHSPIMEEAERGLLSEGLEQRKEAFKDDEELMKETTRFVADVIETATTEVSRRKCQQTQEIQADEGSSLRGGERLRGWNSRARGFCNRILNAVCPCITTNVESALVPTFTPRGTGHVLAVENFEEIKRGQGNRPLELT